MCAKEYNLSNPDIERNETNMPVINVCAANGVESGLPAEEQEISFIDGKRTAILYTEALKNNTANPVFVGMPHAGEFVPQEIFERISDPKAFVDGLDAGDANIFSPQPEENYIVSGTPYTTQIVSL